MPIMAVLAVNFLLSAPAIIPSAVLTRRMSFDRIAVAQLLPSICGGGVAIALAATGWGVWSLVIASLVGSAMGSALFTCYVPGGRVLIFRWSELRSAFHFGANVTGFDVFNYLARNADNFIIGAFLGATTRILFPGVRHHAEAAPCSHGRFDPRPVSSFFPNARR